MQAPSRFATSTSQLPQDGRPSLVAIGNFDGVHRGHRSVLQSAIATAKQAGLRPIVLTFDPHPAEVIGYRKPEMLTRLSRKVELLTALDEELWVLAHPFDKQFAAQTPEAFAQELLAGALKARFVVVGENFRFGRKRAGNLETLKGLGETSGFEPLVKSLLGDADGAWSSTRIRKALASGDLKTVHSALGRPHLLRGTVVTGQQKARHFGFPTANLSGVSEALPPFGVYGVRVQRVTSPGEREFLGVGITNIGNRPTLEAGFCVEVHVFDYKGDLYGQELEVELLDHGRPEKKFPSFDELVKQIHQDCADAKLRLRPFADGSLPPIGDMVPGL